MACPDYDEIQRSERFDTEGDEYAEPIGSCDECGGNLYRDDEWDGLCNQCAWHAEQG